MKRISASPVIDLKMLLRRSGTLPAPLNEGQVSFYGYGRVALLAGLEALGIKKGDNVLLPSYVCNVLLSPFNHLGIKIKYFNVMEDLSPDLEDIEKRIDKDTRAVLVVNYFGFPAKLCEIRLICDKNKLYFIEDNAHGLFSKAGNRNLGTFGDISIFSIRKTLPVPNGAALKINNPGISIKEFPALKAAGVGPMYYLRQLDAFLSQKTGIRIKARLKSLSGAGERYYAKEEPVEEEANINKYFVKQAVITDLILKKSDPLKMAYIRRKAFDHWLKNLPEGIPIHNKLPEGVVPYVFPLRIKDRDGFVSRMYKKGIECFTWPTLPSGVKDCPAFYREIAVIPLWSGYGN